MLLLLFGREAAFDAHLRIARISIFTAEDMAG